MKILKYLFNGNPVEMGWNEANEEIAKREADEGKYTIDDDGTPESVSEPTVDEILNAMLGVSRYA